MALVPMIGSVFRGGDFLIIKQQQYPAVLRQIVRNIQRMPEAISRELADVHDATTLKIITKSGISKEAKEVLVAHIELIDKNSKELKIISMSNIGPFFESGVRRHMVHPSMVSVSGRLVADWLEQKGLPQAPFEVGGANSTLKKPGLRFMELGYETSWKVAPNVTNRIIKQV